MKVLFITTCPCFYRVRFFEELGKYCDLTVVYEDGTKQYTKESKNYYRLDTKGRYTIKSLRRLSVGRYNFAWGLFRYIKESSFDAVIFGIVESFSCMLAMQKMHDCGMPYLLNIDGLHEKKRPWPKEFACHHFISMAPLLLSPSKANDKVLVSYGARQESIRRFPFASYYASQILTHGLTRKDRLEAQKELSLPLRNYVVSIGRLIELKNPLTLLRVWNEVSSDEDCLLLIGKGEMQEEVEKAIAEQTKDNVRLIGFVDAEQIPLYYRASSFSVLFSHEDAWGLVISESLANGTPVVATDACYAATELVASGKTGLVIPDDENELRQAFKTMLSLSETDLEEMSRNAVACTKDYSIENMAEVHMEILREFCSRNALI